MTGLPCELEVHELVGLDWRSHGVVSRDFLLKGKEPEVADLGVIRKL